jgi:hypothetical protein
MPEVLAVLTSFPTAVFTTVMLLCLVYWTFVILGALDLDFLGGAEGHADGALEGAAKGAMQGVFEGADAIDAKSGMVGGHLGFTSPRTGHNFTELLCSFGPFDFRAGLPLDWVSWLVGREWSLHRLQPRFTCGDFVRCSAAR